MSDRPLVSVVMPVFNAEKYLKDSIESVLNQTYQNIEFIIVNDASTDKSKEIILSYSDPRIKYFEHPVNAGLVKVRNRCLSHTTGSYIAILDSDDIALPYRLEKQVAFLEANPDYNMCGTNYGVIDSDGVLLHRIDLPGCDDDIKTFLNFGNCFCHSSVMIRNNMGEELRYAEGLDYVEDYDLLYRIAKKGKVVNLAFYATLYRVHGSNISIQKQRQMLLMLEKMNARILTELGIPFSIPELEMHSRFLRTDLSYFEQDVPLNQLDHWLIKVSNRLKSFPQLNEKLLAEIFVTRWVKICSKTGQYSKLVWSSVLFKYKSTYWKYIIGKMKEKFQKVNIEKGILFRML